MNQSLMPEKARWKSWPPTLPLRQLRKLAADARQVFRNLPPIVLPIPFRALSRNHTKLRQPIVVIVPAYRGLSQTRRCLESVVHSRNRTPHQVFVINDCSPEPDMSSYLHSLVQSASLKLIEHTENWGYTRTVNQGIELAGDSDVVLLNSDTEVANDWLDRLSHAAYSESKVATVTPFSNNATLCSYPKSFAVNDLPVGWTTAKLDSLIKKTNPDQVLHIPTAVGFCMYMRRDCIDDIGVFDAVAFPGYGEENDFCLRAQAAGWTNLLAADTFVFHQGAVSFAEESTQKKAEATSTLIRKHPDYEERIADHIKHDPARRLRVAIDLQRLRRSSRQKVLIVVSDIKTGTDVAITEFASALDAHAECLLLSVTETEFHLRWINQGEAMTISYSLQMRSQLIETLRAIGVGRIHIERAINDDSQIHWLVRQLKVPLDCLPESRLSGLV